MATKTVKLKLKSSNILSNQSSEVKKNLEVIHDYSELWEDYGESNIQINNPSGSIEANKELVFECILNNLPPEIENLKNNNDLHFIYDWSLTQSSSISDSTIKRPTIIFPQGGENILVKVVVTCTSDIGNFQFSKKTASKFITVKDDIPAIWDKWKIDSSNSSDGVIRITDAGNSRVGNIESLRTYKLVFDIIRSPDEINTNSNLNYYWETDGSGLLSANRDVTPTITWDKVTKKENKAVNLRIEYDDPNNSDYYLPFKTLVRQFEVNPNYEVEWDDWAPSIILPSEIVSDKKQKYDVDLTNLGLINIDDLVFNWSSNDPGMDTEDKSIKAPSILWESTGQKTLTVEITHKTEDLTKKTISETFNVGANIENIWSEWNPSIAIMPGKYVSGSEIAFAVSPLPPSELNTDNIQYEWTTSDNNATVINPYSRGSQITFYDSEDTKTVSVVVRHSELEHLENKELETDLEINPNEQQEWANITSNSFSISGPSSAFTEQSTTYTVTGVSEVISNSSSLDLNKISYTFRSTDSNVEGGVTTTTESKDIKWDITKTASLIVEIEYQGLDGIKSLEKEVEVSKNPENVWNNMSNNDVYIDNETEPEIRLDPGTTHQFHAHVNLPTILNEDDLEYQWVFGTPNQSNPWTSPSKSNSYQKTFPNKTTGTIFLRVSHVNYSGILETLKTVIIDYSESEKKSLWNGWNPTMSSNPSNNIKPGDTVDFEVDVSGFPSKLEDNSLTYTWTPSTTYNQNSDYTIDSENDNQATITLNNPNTISIECVIQTSESGISGQTKNVTKSVDVGANSFNMTINDPGTVRTTDNTFTISGTLDDVNGDSSANAIANKTISANISQSDPSLNSPSTSTDSGGGFTFDVSINGFEGDMDINFSIDSAESEHTHVVTVESEASYSMTISSSFNVPKDASKYIIGKLDSYGGSSNSSAIGNKTININHNDGPNIESSVPNSTTTDNDGNFSFEVSHPSQSSSGSSTLELYPDGSPSNPETVTLNYIDILPHHKTVDENKLSGYPNFSTYYKDSEVLIHPDNNVVVLAKDDLYMIVGIVDNRHEGISKSEHDVTFKNPVGYFIARANGFSKNSGYYVIPNGSAYLYTNGRNNTGLTIWEFSENGNTLSNEAISETPSSNFRRQLFTSSYLIKFNHDDDTDGLDFYDHFNNFLINLDISGMFNSIDNDVQRYAIDSTGEFLVIANDHANNNDGSVKVLKIKYDNNGDPSSVSSFFELSGDYNYSYFGHEISISSNVHGDTNYRRLAVANSANDEIEVHEFSVNNPNSITLIKTIYISSSHLDDFDISFDGSILAVLEDDSGNYSVEIYKE